MGQGESVRFLFRASGLLWSIQGSGDNFQVRTSSTWTDAQVLNGQNRKHNPMITEPYTPKT